MTDGRIAKARWILPSVLGIALGACSGDGSGTNATSQGGAVRTQFGSAIHDGLFKSRFASRMKFTIMWENQPRGGPWGISGIAGQRDLFDNLLPFWIESWNADSAVASVWVKVDSIPPSGVTTLRMHYGNASAAGASDPQAALLFFDAAGKEVEESQAFLGRVQAEFTAAGIPTESELAYGEPAKEIVNWVHKNGCDLVAMSTHGHQLIADLVLGTTAIRVQHSLKVPVLLLRAK